MAASSNDCSLVLGGVRSGKSRYAENRARSRRGNLNYVATAEAHDAEMAERIGRHKLERGNLWTTHEVPRDLVGCLYNLDADREAIVLVDCLTLWLTNLIQADCDVGWEGDRLADFILGSKQPLFIVSNEVGLGIVPENALARRFRDEAGILNQKVAAAASSVVFMAAGLPMVLKG